MLRDTRKTFEVRTGVARSDLSANALPVYMRSDHKRRGSVCCLITIQIYNVQHAYEKGKLYCRAVMDTAHMKFKDAFLKKKKKSTHPKLMLNPSILL